MVRFILGLISLSVIMMLGTVSVTSAQEQPKIADKAQTREEAVRRSQEWVIKEVRHELLMMPYYSVFDWIEYEVRPDLTVVLRGQVVSPPDKRSHAEAAVRRVEGVSRIVNNIEVLPVSPQDDRLRLALYRSVYSGPLFRYGIGSRQDIHIIVNRGRATLKGVVDSESDRIIAYHRARSVPGLFEVNNELAIRGSQRNGSL